MEKNKQWKRVPFDAELVKKIQSGEVEGRIVSDSEHDVRVVCFDKRGSFPIVALINLENGDHEFVCEYNLQGINPTRNMSLFIELPEETPKHEFKVGDYVQYGEGKFFKEKLEIVKIDNSIPNNVWIECSTEDGLINIKCPILEVKPYEEKHEFKPFDKVLVRQSDKDDWRVALYSHFNPKENLHVTAWLDWYQCIPYEGNEHLVGTINKPE